MQKNNQQKKYDPKGKAITSLVLGIISGAPMMFLVSMGILAYYMRIMGGGTMPPLFQHIVLFPLYTLMSIMGLIFGIQGLKSTKKNFAIAGTILCAIGLFLRLYIIVS